MSKAIAAKLLKGEADYEMMRDLQQMLGLTNAVLVRLARSMACALLRRHGVPAPLVERLDHYDGSTANEDVDIATSIAAKLMQGLRTN